MNNTNFNRPINKIILYYSIWLKNNAEIIIKYFNQLGIECESKINSPIEQSIMQQAYYNPNLFLFIFCPQLQFRSLKEMDSMPYKKFFLYQAEQLNITEHSYYKISKIYNLINNSICCFDYSRLTKCI